MVHTMISETDHYGGCILSDSVLGTLMYKDHERLTIVKAVTDPTPSWFNLPDARLLQLGTTYYFIVILNSMNVRVGDWDEGSDTSVLGPELSAGNTRMVTLTDNSTYHGEWEYEDMVTNPQNLVLNPDYPGPPIESATIVIPYESIFLPCGTAASNGQVGQWVHGGTWTSGDIAISLSGTAPTGRGDAWYQGGTNEIGWADYADCADKVLTTGIGHDNPRTGQLRAYIKRIDAITCRVRICAKTTMGTDFEDTLFEGDCSLEGGFVDNAITETTHTTGQNVTSGSGGTVSWGDSEHTEYVGGFPDSLALVYGYDGRIFVRDIVESGGTPANVSLPEIWQLRQYIAGVAQSNYMYTHEDLLHYDNKYVVLTGQTGRWLVTDETDKLGMPISAYNIIESIHTTAT